MKCIILCSLDACSSFFHISYQVANYGIGGHYSAHQDPMFVYKEPTDLPVRNIEEDPHIKREPYITGDRMSTFMIYLSEV